jgi:parallel beta-helix repeat protein
MPKHRRPRRPRRLSPIEVLEGRSLLSTFVVNNPADTGTGTLRAAILAADTPGGPTVIDFALPSGMLTIKPGSALPAITASVTIDGTSQTGFGTTPLVVIDGTNAGATVSGLTATAPGVIIKGLVIDNFGSSGVVLSGSGTDQVLGSYIGVEADGLTLAANGLDGVLITAGSGDIISQDILSGNAANGLEIDTPASGTAVSGSFMGLGSDGVSTVPNGASGVFLNGTTGTTIGGTATGLANVISGNNVAGLVINGSGNMVVGDLIGVASDGVTNDGNGASGLEISGSNNTITGDVISGNTADGVVISGSASAAASGNLITDSDIGVASDGTTAVVFPSLLTVRRGVVIGTFATGNTVGGSTSGTQDIISGNNGAGVVIESAGNVVAGSFIGVGADGTTVVPNNGAGVLITAPSNTVGGTTGAAGNLISGNESGVQIQGPNANSNVIEQNDIGTDVSTETAIGNNLGVVLQGVGNTQIIGNVISGNQIGGVFLSGGGGFNVVSGNLIGTDQGGTNIVANSGFGIEVSGETGDFIGGSSTGSRNVISGNGATGIAVISSSLTAIVNNIIGLDQSGLVTAQATGNRADGIDVTGSSQGTLIGGLTSGTGNLITSNGGSGIFVQSPAVTTTIEGNLVGTDSTAATGPGNAKFGIWANGAAVVLVRNVVSDNQGSAGILLQGGSGSVVQGNLIGNTDGKGNAGIGLWVNASSSNTIGGTSPAAQNIISGNATFGISVANGANNNLIVDNWIGLDASGNGGQGNATGIGVNDSAGTTIGGTTAGSTNVIDSNSLYGISVTGPTSTGTLILSNVIGLAADSTTAAGNGSGVGIFSANGVLIQGNILSGNTYAGVFIVGGSGSVIQGNLIGTDDTGTIARGNGYAGVQVSGASGTLVGGITPSARNLISGNGFVGVQVDGALATSDVIEGNWIGVDVTGTKALGNKVEGVFLAAPGVLVGNIVPGGRNVISGNGFFGVHLVAGSNGSAVSGNWIGLDATGTKALGNAVYGVYFDGAGGSVLGGPTSAWTNVITGSNTADVVLAFAGSTGDLVEANDIGTNAAATLALSPAPDGIEIFDAPSNTIGGSTSGTANVILGHGTAGINISGTTASGNLVIGNKIGPGNVGQTTRANFFGLVINGAPNNTIGGKATGLANVIQGNKFNQIFVFNATGNQTADNTIGPDF